MIDTHAHLNFKVFEDDWEEVVSRAKVAGVKKILIVGTDVKTSKKAVEMARQDPDLYASVGIHPHHAKQFLNSKSEILNKSQISKMDESLQLIEEMISDKNVVAVGEIGIDYHVYQGSKKYEKVVISDELIEIQKRLFIAQVELATKRNKPVIVHTRKAKQEVLELLLDIEKKTGKKLRAVFHCFEGSKKYAKKILEAGFCISFVGNITYDHGRAEVSKAVPLNKLLLETDCPYMTPAPLRENRQEGKPLRNEPINVKITACHHALLRDVPVEEIIEQTTKNAHQLFGI